MNSATFQHTYTAAITGKKYLHLWNHKHGRLWMFRYGRRAGPPTTWRDIPTPRKAPSKNTQRHWTFTVNTNTPNTRHHTWPVVCCRRWHMADGAEVRRKNTPEGFILYVLCPPVIIRVSVFHHMSFTARKHTSWDTETQQNTINRWHCACYTITTLTCTKHSTVIPLLSQCVLKYSNANLKLL